MNTTQEERDYSSLLFEPIALSSSSSSRPAAADTTTTTAITTVAVPPPLPDNDNLTDKDDNNNDDNNNLQPSLKRQPLIHSFSKRSLLRTTRSRIQEKEIASSPMRTDNINNNNSMVPLLQDVSLFTPIKSLSSQSSFHVHSTHHPNNTTNHRHYHQSLDQEDDNHEPDVNNDENSNPLHRETIHGIHWFYPQPHLNVDPHNNIDIQNNSNQFNPQLHETPVKHYSVEDAFFNTQTPLNLGKPTSNIFSSLNSKKTSDNNLLNHNHYDKNTLENNSTNMNNNKSANNLTENNFIQLNTINQSKENKPASFEWDSAFETPAKPPKVEMTPGKIMDQLREGDQELFNPRTISDETSLPQHHHRSTLHQIHQDQQLETPLKKGFLSCSSLPSTSAPNFNNKQNLIIGKMKWSPGFETPLLDKKSKVKQNVISPHQLMENLRKNENRFLFEQNSPFMIHPIVNSAKSTPVRQHLNSTLVIDHTMIPKDDNADDSNENSAHIDHSNNSDNDDTSIEEKNTNSANQIEKTKRLLIIEKRLEEEEEDDEASLLDTHDFFSQLCYEGKAGIEEFMLQKTEANRNEDQIISLEQLEKAKDDDTKQDNELLFPPLTETAEHNNLSSLISWKDILIQSTPPIIELNNHANAFINGKANEQESSTSYCLENLSAYTKPETECKSIFKTPKVSRTSNLNNGLKRTHPTSPSISYSSYSPKLTFDSKKNSNSVNIAIQNIDRITSNHDDHENNHNKLLNLNKDDTETEHHHYYEQRHLRNSLPIRLNLKKFKVKVDKTPIVSVRNKVISQPVNALKKSQKNSKPLTQVHPNNSLENHGTALLVNQSIMNKSVITSPLIQNSILDDEHYCVQSVYSDNLIDSPIISRSISNANKIYISELENDKENNTLYEKPDINCTSSPIRSLGEFQVLRNHNNDELNEDIKLQNQALSAVPGFSDDLELEPDDLTMSSQFLGSTKRKSKGNNLNSNQCIRTQDKFGCLRDIIDEPRLETIDKNESISDLLVDHAEYQNVSLDSLASIHTTEKTKDDINCNNKTDYQSQQTISKLSSVGLDQETNLDTEIHMKFDTFHERNLNGSIAKELPLLHSLAPTDAHNVPRNQSLTTAYQTEQQVPKNRNITHGNEIDENENFHKVDHENQNLKKDNHNQQQYLLGSNFNDHSYDNNPFEASDVAVNLNGGISTDAKEHGNSVYKDSVDFKQSRSFQAFEQLYETMNMNHGVVDGLDTHLECGFKTAFGRKVGVSKDAIARAKNMFFQDTDYHMKEDDKDEELDLECGFNTAFGKKVGISRDSIARAKSLFFQDDDYDTKEDNNEKRFEMGGGFQKANGKKVCVSEDSVAKARAMFFQDDNYDMKEYNSEKRFEMAGGFTTATGKKLEISEKSLAFAKNLFAADDDADFSKDFGFNGISSAQKLPQQTPFKTPLLLNKRSEFKNPVPGQRNSPFKPHKFSNPASRLQTPSMIPLSCNDHRDSNFKKPTVTVSATNGGSAAGTSRGENNTFGQGLTTASGKPTGNARISAGKQTANLFDIFSLESPQIPSHQSKVLQTPTMCHRQSKPFVTPLIRKTPTFNHLNINDNAMSLQNHKLTPFKTPLVSSSNSSKFIGLGTSINKPFKTPVTPGMTPSLLTKRTLNLNSMNNSFSKKMKQDDKASESLVNRKPSMVQVMGPPFAWKKGGSPIHPLFEQFECLTWSKEQLDDYSFNVSSSQPMEMDSNSCEKNGDNTTMINNIAYEAHKWGPNEAFEEMKIKVLSLVSINLNWVKNHYGLILWKFVGYIKAYPEMYPNIWNKECVLQELIYRYEKEVNQTKRSCIKLISEKDDTPARHFVLCVVSIINSVSDGSCKLLLTDGWYCIHANVDFGIQRLVKMGLVYPGIKLSVCGSKIVGNQEPCHVLDLTPNTSLKLEWNSIRRASWDTPLGYQPNRFFTVSLASLKPEGGQVPCIDVIICRRYPIKFMETMKDGSRVFRTGKEEKQADIIWSNEFDKLFEKKMGEEMVRRENEKQKLVLQRYNQQKRRKSNHSNLTNHESDDHHRALMLDDGFGSNLCDPFSDNTMNRMDRSNVDWLAVKENVRRDIEENHLAARNSISFLKLLICDYCPDARYRNYHARKAYLTVWQPDELFLERVTEGSRIQVIQALACPSYNSGQNQHNQTDDSKTNMWLLNRRNGVYQQQILSLKTTNLKFRMLGTPSHEEWTTRSLYQPRECMNASKLASLFKDHIEYIMNNDDSNTTTTPIINSKDNYLSLDENHSEIIFQELDTVLRICHLDILPWEWRIVASDETQTPIYLNLVKKHVLPFLPNEMALTVGSILILKNLSFKNAHVASSSSLKMNQTALSSSNYSNDDYAVLTSCSDTEISFVARTKSVEETRVQAIEQFFSIHPPQSHSYRHESINNAYVYDARNIELNPVLFEPFPYLSNLNPRSSLNHQQYPRFSHDDNDLHTLTTSTVHGIPSVLGGYYKPLEFKQDGDSKFRMNNQGDSCTKTCNQIQQEQQQTKECQKHQQEAVRDIVTVIGRFSIFPFGIKMCKGNVLMQLDTGFDTKSCYFPPELFINCFQAFSSDDLTDLLGILGRTESRQGLYLAQDVGKAIQYQQRHQGQVKSHENKKDEKEDEMDVCQRVLDELSEYIFKVKLLISFSSSKTKNGHYSSTSSSSLHSSNMKATTSFIYHTPHDNSNGQVHGHGHCGLVLSDDRDVEWMVLKCECLSVLDYIGYLLNE